MGRPAAANAAWPQRRGGGLSLVTGRPRDLTRVRKVLSALPRRVQYSFLRMSIYSFLLQHDRCCRRRRQRHGRIKERSGPEMYTVSCATSSLLPLLRVPSSHRVGFGRCSPSTTSTTQRTSRFPNPRRPLVSVSSRSRRIRKLLPQLCVCVSRLVDKYALRYAKGHSAQPDMFWRTHHTKSDPEIDADDAFLLMESIN